MSGRVDRLNEPISRVKCVVDSCSYWHANHCHASSIEVQPPNASNSEMTDCATFAPKM